MAVRLMLMDRLSTGVVTEQLSGFFGGMGGGVGGGGGGYGGGACGGIGGRGRVWGGGGGAGGEGGGGCRGWGYTKHCTIDRSSKSLHPKNTCCE